MSTSTLSRRPGRPSKMTHQATVKVIAAVALGLPLQDAARRAGVNPSTLRRWRAHDPVLDEAVEAARADFVARQVERVDEAGAGDWRAAAWLLERRAPASFGKRTVVEVDTAPMAVVDPLTGQVLGG